jgi:hypothetical protein
MNTKLRILVLISSILAIISIVFVFGQSKNLLRYSSANICYGFHHIASPQFASWHRINEDPLLILMNRYQFRFPVQHWLQLQIMNPVTGDVKQIVEFPTRSNINAFVLLENQSVIAITRGFSESAEILLFSLEADGLPERFSTINGAEQVVWHPNAPRLATIYYPEGYDHASNIIALYDVGDMSLSQTDTFSLKRIAISQILGWSNDGQIVAVSQVDRIGEIPYYIFVEMGQIQESLYRESRNNCVSNGQWSPRASVLAFSGTNTETEGWDIFLETVAFPDRADRPLINLTNTPGEDELHPTWSPDGNHLAYVKVYIDAADNRRQELFVIDLNDATYTPIQLTDTPDGLADKPVWLSDDEIAYLSWSLTEHTWSLKNVSLVDHESRKVIDIPQVWYREP